MKWSHSDPGSGGFLRECAARGWLPDRAKAVREPCEEHHPLPGQERRHWQILPAQDPESDHRGESGRETGKTELCLLSLLSGVKGVVQCHNTFMDTCLQEDDGRYIGKRIWRVVLVPDCLVSQDFSAKTRDQKQDQKDLYFCPLLVVLLVWRSFLYWCASLPVVHLSITPV